MVYPLTLSQPYLLHPISCSKWVAFASTNNIPALFSMFYFLFICFERGEEKQDDGHH